MLGKKAIPDLHSVTKNRRHTVKLLLPWQTEQQLHRCEYDRKDIRISHFAFSHEFWVSNLGFHAFYGKHFADWAISTMLDRSLTKFLKNFILYSLSSLEIDTEMPIDIRIYILELFVMLEKLEATSVSQDRK